MWDVGYFPNMMGKKKKKQDSGKEKGDTIDFAYQLLYLTYLNPKTPYF